MRTFLTGGTGFIGSKLAGKLRERGDHVTAVVRNESKASHLKGLECEVIVGDLGDVSATSTLMKGCDAVFHLAGRFDIGVPASERDNLMKTNVDLAAAVIDSAVEANVPRIVFASTINVFGDTRGAVVSETHRREGDKFLSLYDESKFRAHEIALQRARQGAPVVLVQPGLVYGPNDHFEIGREILLASRGELKLLMLADVGVTMSYVDDVANGFIAAAERGRTGESYVLGGEIVRLHEVLELAARIAGKRFTPMPVPTAVLKLIAPIGPWVAPRLGYSPNLRELIRVSDGTTYWADSGKAERELNYSSRSLEQGIKDLLAQ